MVKGREDRVYSTIMIVNVHSSHKEKEKRRVRYNRRYIKTEPTKKEKSSYRVVRKKNESTTA